LTATNKSCEKEILTQHNQTFFTLTFLSLLETFIRSSFSFSYSRHDRDVATTVLDRKSDKSARWIKEAVHTRKEGLRSLDQDERELHAKPHVRPISCHVASLSWQEPEELNKLLLMKVTGRD